MEKINKSATLGLLVGWLITDVLKIIAWGFQPIPKIMYWIFGLTCAILWGYFTQQFVEEANREAKEKVATKKLRKK